MRSTLIRKDVLIEDNAGTRINLSPADPLLKGVLDTIVSFIMDAKKEGKVSFERLYNKLTKPEYHIGLRNGVIPIYIAAVFHNYREDIILQNDMGLVPLSLDTLEMINADPSRFQMVYLDWNAEKQRFINRLADLFSRFVIQAEKNSSAYDFVASAMKRWYLSLPRYAKETKGQGENTVNPSYRKLLKLLKQNINGHDLLFKKLPEAFGYKEFNEGLADNIEKAKEYYDKRIDHLKDQLISRTKKIFSVAGNRSSLDRISLSSVIKDWCETLDPHVFEQLFEDGTDKCLGLFKDVSNDDHTFIARLAKVATDLRLEDWDDNTVTRYEKNLNQYKETAKSFTSDSHESVQESTSTYEIRFGGEDGKSEVKRFDRVEISRKGKLLYNSILDAIDSMGYSISEQEKRQILIDILKDMC